MRFKNKLVLLLTLTILFNFTLTSFDTPTFTTTVYAEPENDEDDDGRNIFQKAIDKVKNLAGLSTTEGRQYKDEDLDDLEELLDIGYSDEVFAQIIDATVSVESGDYFMSKYRDNKDIENKVPHVPLFGGPDKFMTFDLDNSSYYSKRYMEAGYGDYEIQTEYYIDRYENSFVMDSASGNKTGTKGISINTKALQQQGTSARVYMNNIGVLHRDYVWNKAGKKFKKDEYQLGYDSYGNVITNDRKVVTPFYMDPKITRRVVETNKDLFPGAYENSKKNMFVIPLPLSGGIMDNLAKNKKLMKSDAKLYPFYIDKKGVRHFIAGDISESIAGSVTPKQMWEWYDRNKNKIDENATKEYIFKMYRGVIKEYHEHFMKTFSANLKEFRDGEDKVLPYFGNSTYGNPSLSKSPEDIVEDGAESLGAMIKEILEGGFGNLFRLSLAYIIAEAYQSMFIDFSANNIHYTGYYKDSNLFENLFGMYLTIVVVLLVLYITLNTIHMARGVVTFRDLIVKVSVLLLVTLLPVLAYPQLINISFNKTTQRISETDIHQMLLLDRWIDKAEEQTEELEKKLQFSLDREFRGNKHNYLIKFTSEQFRNARSDEIINDFTGVKDDQGLIELDRERSESNKPRVNVYVDALHLLEYFSESREEDLFSYLSSEYSDIYENLVGDSGIYGFTDIDEFAGETREYSEYKKYIDILNNKGDALIERGGNFLSKDKLDSDYITASSLGMKIFKYYQDNEVNLSERFRELDTYLLHPYLKNSERDNMISMLSDIPSEANKQIVETLEENDFLTTPEYSKFEKMSTVLETSSYGDIGDIFGLMTEISVIDGNDVDGTNELYIRQLTKRINRNIIQHYQDTISTVSRMNSELGGYGDSYTEAEDDILILSIIFEVLREVDSNHFPTGISVERVESDIFMRGLLVPIKDITPDNLELENTSMYMGATKGVVALLLFVVLIILMVLYGLLKLLIISTLLLPVFVLLAIWNYLIVSNTESKLWFGALYILGLFTAVHIGFLGLWKFASYNMNSALSGKLTGRVSYFNTQTNMIIMIAYFIIAGKFVIFPMLKTVRANFSDLGGEKFFAQVGERVQVMREWGEDIKRFINPNSAGNDDPTSTENTKETQRDKNQPQTMEERKAKRLKDEKDTADNTAKKVEDKDAGLEKDKDADKKDTEMDEVKGEIDMKKKATFGDKARKGLDKAKKGANKELDKRVSKRAKRRMTKAGKSVGDVLATTGKVAKGTGKVAGATAMVLGATGLMRKANDFGGDLKQGGKKALNKLPQFIKDKNGFLRDITLDKRGSLGRLKDLGVLSAGVGSELVKGKYGTQIALANGAMALGVEALMRSKGFNTKRNGKNLHIEASEGEMMALQEEIAQAINDDKDKYLSVGESGDTISNLVNTGRKSVSLQGDDDLHEYLQGLQDEGTIESLLSLDGDMSFTISPDELENLEGDPRFAGMETFDILSMDKNKATLQAYDLLKDKEGLGGLIGNNEETLNFAYDGDISALRQKMGSVSDDLNIVNDYGISGENVTRLNKNNPRVQEEIDYLTRSGQLPSGSYTEEDGQYIPITNEMKEKFRDIYYKVNQNLSKDTETYDNFKDIEISPSSKFKGSDINRGRKHTISDLNYSPEEIHLKMEELSRYKGTDAETIMLRNKINKAHKMRINNEHLEVFTEKDVTNEQIQQLLIKVQEQMLAEERNKNKHE